MIEINNIAELNNFTTTVEFRADNRDRLVPTFVNLNINFNLKVHSEINFIFGEHEIWGASRCFGFSNCCFTEGITFHHKIEHEYTFNECVFNKLSKFSNAIFLVKTCFYNCHFKGDTNFFNAKFHKLIDFFNSTFDKKTIFLKTDFLATTVFSATTFNDNVLFTYSLIDKLILFRGAKINKGFDISLAIINGNLGVFDFKVPDYFVLEQYQAKLVYERNVGLNGDIPIKNKRETFRILKKTHESQSNIVESIPFKVLEKETLKKELETGNKTGNKIILCLNKLTNNYGDSWTKALKFILITGFFVFSVLLGFTTKYEFTYNVIEWDFLAFFNEVDYFVQFLSPTHKANFMNENLGYEKGFYAIDFLGRIIIGFGIYQMVQAFRKYR